MRRKQASERLLEAAKRVAVAEEAAKTARAEYELLFRQAVSGTGKRGPRVPAPVAKVGSPIPAELESAGNRAGRNGHSASVEDRVLIAMREHYGPSDAKAIAKATQIAENTVRWAFTVLMEDGRIRRVSRGKYTAATVGTAASARE